MQKVWRIFRFCWPGTFEPPDVFSCSPAPRLGTVDTTADWDPPARQPPKPIDGYRCTAVGKAAAGQAARFDLNDVLDRAIGPGVGEIRAGKPFFSGESGPPPGPLATPDLIKCHWVPNAVTGPDRNADDFSCEFPENQQTCVFTLGGGGDLRHVLVATNIDVVDTQGKMLRDDLDKISCSSHSRATRCPPLCLQVRMLPAKVRRSGSSVWCWPLVGRWWEAW